MSQGLGQNELQAKTRQLMDGPLKHIRGAALAAALLPLASVAATPASAQGTCASGGVCGIVFNDANNNGFQDAGETGIPLAKVFVCPGVVTCDANNPDAVMLETNPDGSFSLFEFAGTYTVAVQIPTGTQASPPNIQSNTQDTFDSDGVPDGSGYSVVTVTVADAPFIATDFGFAPSGFSNPGTGTPGYWKNHPEAWPVSSIVVGGNTYTKAQAIAWLGKVGKDKTTTIFASYVAAWLSVEIGNDPSCVASAMASADGWLAAHPVGSGVAGSSAAWQTAEPWHQTMDAYNNGLLCAPHRQ